MIVIGIKEGLKIRYVFSQERQSSFLHATLCKHYRCPKKVRQLIDLGDIRELKFNIDDTSKYCCGYDYKKYGDGNEFFLKVSGYHKFLFMNGTWYVQLMCHTKCKLLKDVEKEMFN